MTALLNPQDPEQLAIAARLLKCGAPLGVPAETVYGLAAVLREEALAQIFSLKARPHFDPLIVHVSSWAQALEYVKHSTPLHEKLARAFWPGPLTLLFEKNSRVPDLCTAGSPFVALRMPSHPAFLALLREAGEPLAAPSANRFGRISPTRAQHVVEELGPYGLEAVLDGGASALGLESTVVKIHSPLDLEIIRLGALSTGHLREVLGEGVTVRVRASGTGAVEESPGQLKSHYAPRVPLTFIEDPAEGCDAYRTRDLSHTALLVAYPQIGLEWQKLSFKKVVVLSESGSDTEAAARLFQTMRHLESEKIERIVALASPENGLGHALNDRLRRASS